MINWGKMVRSITTMMMITKISEQKAPMRVRARGFMDFGMMRSIRCANGRMT